ncbi:MAG: hypothetical protein LPK25_16280 [Cyclobacteriaceae bacterium]|nr:hypothetical protein [Cyclobacteriaceae bacterium]MDX5467926.1 hypothetical protein [Cyclobacteriaceae bacterium]
MKKFWTTAFLFGFLAILPAGCGIFCNDSCGCSPDFPEQSVRVRSFEVLTFSTGGQQISPNLPQPFDQVVKGFRIKEFDLISEVIREAESPGILGFAFACSPPPLKVKEKLTQLKIINLREVQLGNGMIWEPGQNITEHFGMNSFYNGNLLPIQQYLNNGLTLFLDDLYKVGLRTNPGKTLDLDISLTLVLEGGKEFLIGPEKLRIQGNE